MLHQCVCVYSTMTWPLQEVVDCCVRKSSGVWKKNRRNKRRVLYISIHVYIYIYLSFFLLSRTLEDIFPFLISHAHFSNILDRISGSIGISNAVFCVSFLFSTFSRFTQWQFRIIKEGKKKQQQEICFLFPS